MRTFASRGVRVVSSGVLTGDELAPVIDKHYGTLAERAMTTSPSKLPPISAKTLNSFKTKFGEDYKAALANGRVLNLNEAIGQKVFGVAATMADIEQQWRAGPCQKLFPGTYIAKAGDVYVINGFYGSMREIFIQVCICEHVFLCRLLV